MNNDLVVKDVIDTMSDEQKNTLYFYVGAALKGKEIAKHPCAAIESFDENQKKVFYYLIGAALEEKKKKEVSDGNKN